jgi:RNA polymerase sigma-70 factor (ECF subfamily)
MINLELLSDTDLIKHYQATRNKGAVGVLFKRYIRFVFLVSMKYFRDEEKAKDAVMQVFEGLFMKLLKHDIRTFKPWLHRVVINHCLLELRRTKETVPIDAVNYKEWASAVESMPLLYLADDSGQRLKNLDDSIQLLSKEQRICIELFYLKQKHYDEVSRETGYTYKQVKSYIQNGKRNLRIIMEKKNEH